MKKILAYILFLSIAGICLAQTSGDYRVRSSVTTGNWGSASSWEKYTTSWVNATAAPTASNANVVTIQNGKTINIAANVIADQIVVQGALIVNASRTLTVYDSDGIDVNVSGTFTINGTVVFANSSYASGTGTFTLSSGSTLITDNADGIASSGSSGCVQTTTRNLISDANYGFIASNYAQITGTGLPSTVNSLTIGNYNGLSLTNGVTVTEELVFSDLGIIYLGNNDLYVSESATVSGYSQFRLDGSGDLVDLSSCNYLEIFVPEPHVLPSTIDDILFQSNNPIIMPNDITVTNMVFNGDVQLNGKRITVFETGAAFKGDSNISDLNVYMSETQNISGTYTSIARTWTTYGIISDPLEMQFSYPEALTSDYSVKVWNRPSNETGDWTLVGIFETSGTDPRTVIVTGIADLGSSDVPMDWTISTNNQTLPVELASFTVYATPQKNAFLQWTTQSETGVSGYYIFRSSQDFLSSAERINAFIEATNTSHTVDYSFTDNEALPGHKLYYWLQSIDINGEFEFHGPVSVEILDNNDDNPIIPLENSLQSIYPNPFNPTTTISYGLSGKAATQITIYDIRGVKVRTLLNASKNPGTYRVVWDGKTDNGHFATTGVYFVKMNAGKYSSTRKVILMK